MLLKDLLYVLELFLIFAAQCALQTNEPGENLRKLEFAWERKVEPTPKCEVIEAWLTEAGLHRRGFVYLTYFGGAGRGLKDCKPNTGLRRALMQLVWNQENNDYFI